MTPATVSSSELRYRRLFEAAHDGILILDPNSGTIIDVNPFLEQFLGYSREEFMGKELFEIGLREDEAASRAAFRQLTARGSIRYENLPLQTKAGRRVEVEFVSNVYREGEQDVIQCNVRDITTRKRTESSLRAAELKRAQHATELEGMVRRRTAELRLSNTQLETFVYSISHDLRAPLSAMQGFAQLLRREHMANLSQQGRDYTNQINTTAQAMDHLLADLLACSQLNRQRTELMPVELETVIQSALACCQLEIRESQARVEAIGPWPAVLAHVATLREVLANLIGNAVKFVAGKKPQIRLRTEGRPGGVVRIWVEDNGVGIPADDHARIFEALKHPHTKPFSGTGIGLAVVQQGMRRMGGRVGVVSAPGEGSRFWIELAEASPLGFGLDEERERYVD